MNQVKTLRENLEGDTSLHRSLRFNVCDLLIVPEFVLWWNHDFDPNDRGKIVEL